MLTDEGILELSRAVEKSKEHAKKSRLATATEIYHIGLRSLMDCDKERKRMGLASLEDLQAKKKNESLDTDDSMEPFNNQKAEDHE